MLSRVVSTRHPCWPQILAVATHNHYKRILSMRRGGREGGMAEELTYGSPLTDTAEPRSAFEVALARFIAFG